MKDVSELKKIERVVVGYILNNENLYITNVEILSRNLFEVDNTCKAVMSAYKQILKEGENPDLLSISEKSGLDITELSDLYTSVDYNIDFRNAVNVLISNQITTSLILKLSETSKQANSGEDIYKVISDLKSFIDSTEIKPIKRITAIDESLRKMFNHIENVYNNKISGIRTGLKKWDSHMGGLQPSDLVIIAAETSQGKTSLALSIAYNAAINEAAKVAIFSFEMSELQLTARLASIESKISSKKLLFSPLQNYEFEQLNSRLQYLPNANIYIDDCSNSSIDYLISGIKVAHMQYGIHVVVIDYLQLVKDASKKGDESEIASNVRRLKNVAKELNITVILLSQLRREQNPKPTMNRLRGSGQIEEAADVIALLWRPEYYGIQVYEDSPLTNTSGSAEIIIAKGRNYGVGKFWLNFDCQTTYFTDAEY